MLLNPITISIIQLPKPNFTIRIDIVFTLALSSQSI